MVELYGIRISDLPSVCDAKKRYACAADWCNRHPHHRDNDATRAGIGGLLLLRAAGVTGKISYTKEGRPLVQDSAVDFNVTHTDRHVFVAIDRGSDPTHPPRVGIDAEELCRTVRGRDSLAARWFSDAERRLLQADTCENAFLRVWTRKEALVKWIGTGFAATATADRDTCAAKERYGVAFWNFCVDGACISVCAREKSRVAGEIRMLSSKELLDLLEQDERKGKETE